MPSFLSRVGASNLSGGHQEVVCKCNDSDRRTVAKSKKLKLSWATSEQLFWMRFADDEPLNKKKRPTRKGEPFLLLKVRLRFYPLFPTLA
jgi:hypothetical protein